MAASKTNLIVTFDPTKLESAKSEIAARLAEIKEKPSIAKIGDGLAEVVVKDAKKTVSQLKKIALKDKEKFSSTFNWIPVDVWTTAKIADMQKAVKDIQKGISEKEKWKMDIGKHKTELHERDLIIKLTEVIDKPNVDLKNPDKIIKVEVIKDKSAISLLKPDELLSVAKL
jgi:tRNA(Ser,Leu) C12 N-acetylase TAN1